MRFDLFSPPAQLGSEQLGAGTWLFPLRALPVVAELADGLRHILSAAPFRHLQTPGGRRMAVAMSNCGRLGWNSDLHGYCYQSVDPLNGRPWPPMPPAFSNLATSAAADAGYPGFQPDACLINRYLPGTRLSLHQDRNECDLQQPVVSISLGMEASFLWGGLQRSKAPLKLALYHGDILVWGGADRLRFHGIAALQGPPHPEWGEQRINLTFRRAR